MRTSRPPHWILGDSSSQRFSDYCAAALNCGTDRPNCINWLEVINHGVTALDRIAQGARLRIDSFGQRRDVLAALIRHGGGYQIPFEGEILSIDRQYLGICQVMQDLSQWSTQRHDLHFDQDPLEIVAMFDKWATHQRLIPHRPTSALLPTDLKTFGDTLKAFLAEAGGRVFVKPRYASSASGVCCYRVGQGRQQLIAPIEILRDGGRVRLFNSLRVRSFTHPRDIQDIFRILAPQEMIAESVISKARVNGDRFDLRVVVIGNVAEHIVVRQSPSPITNLHLGNRRGMIQEVNDAVGATRVEACRQLALQAASRFPRSLYCGVDILLPRSGDPLVCEVNAFGDFLPNLFANGKTVYDAIVQAGNVRQEVTV